MSKYLEIPEKAMTPMCLHKETTFYVLEEHLHSLLSFEDYPNGSSKGQEEKLIQKLMDTKRKNFRMYGSAAELAENMKIYRQFPESHLYFNTDVDTYQVDPIVYQSLKNEKYLCKSDLFPILQNMLMGLDEQFTIEIVSIIAYYLKIQEERVNGKVEFVRVDEKLLEDISKELGEEMAKHDLTAQSFQLAPLLAILDFNQSFQIIQRLCPEIWNDRKHHRVHELITSSCNELPPETRPVVFSIIAKLVFKSLQSLENVIGKHPELFLPYSETENNSMPVTVRMFEDGDQRFVMNAELSDALSRRLDWEDDTNTRFTLNMGDVLEKYGNEKIEFIRYPIRRAKHRAVPIKAGGPNDFFILAVDAFFELMTDLILGAQIFQNNYIGRFSLIFHELEKFFKPDCMEPYFIRTQVSELMKRLMQTVTVNDDEKSPVKCIRNAKPDGFSLQNLKNELKYLELDNSFPEIEEHAEIVYEHVDSVKKEEFLRTCDLFDAIEHCQLICMLNRIPNLKKFLHNQKGCGRVQGLNCDECDKEESPNKQ
ncbi:hypothetical protein GCK72_003934 [Caenorhabditis remanei]|uniref:DUF7809 domain-containing protein n=1 Tax=Caenorhabditis remanei TaxID=31234 RepID=A0A6A5H8C4_CAERE|nr:hypothetical protein GCK72_003934 [Caenorhabditis remanei]KAF1763988.1 hypothetical protein GCK72_003934 [Caenorhabditis remanei]